MTESEKINLSKALDALTAVTNDLQKHWTDYLNLEYENGKYLNDRSYFDDMAMIADYIAEKLKQNDTESFTLLFDALENIFSKYDMTTCSIISAGLLESIQAHKAIDYYFGFNQWLKPATLKWWEGGINYWEGTSWRDSNGC
jgi:hypothetical protein